MRPLTAVVATFALSLAGGLTATFASTSCATFTDEPASADGGRAQPPAARNLTVAIDWPGARPLDPSADPRASVLVVRLVDAADPSRSVTAQPALPGRSPVPFDGFVTTSLVDAFVEIRSSVGGRLLGYGERRRVDVSASSTITVAARKRLLYAASNDRGPEGVGQLRVFDFASDGEELSLKEVTAAVNAPPHAVALYVTSDGLDLVLAGGRSSADALVAVVKTGTHERTSAIALPFVPGAMAPIGAGRQALVFSEAETATASDAVVVDLEARSATKIPAAFDGGKLLVKSAITSPDGERVLVAADHDPSAGNLDATSHLLVFDAKRPLSNAFARVDLAGMQKVASARWTPDGKRIVVAGYTDHKGEDRADGVLQIFDGSAPDRPTSSLAFAGFVRPAALTIDASGAFAFVTGAKMYTPLCCAEMRIVDLARTAESAKLPMDGSDPAHAFPSAVQLPYAPYALVAGESDESNNGPNKKMAEILAGGAAPKGLPVDAIEDLGSFDAIATPYGRPF